MRKDIEINTVISPGKYKEFIDKFFNEKIWDSISIHPDKIEKLKYFAMYEVMPIGEIKWVADIVRLKERHDKP